MTLANVRIRSITYRYTCILGFEAIYTHRLKYPSIGILAYLDFKQ